MVTQVEIDKVTVNDVETTFTYIDPLSTLLPYGKKDPFHHLELSEGYVKAVQEGNKGELAVDVPESVEITKVYYCFWVYIYFRHRLLSIENSYRTDLGTGRDGHRTCTN